MSDDINITYDLLFDTLRTEKSRDELQKLDENFFRDVVEYIKGKEAIMLNAQTSPTERELTRIQLNNVKKILVELYERRERKIINLAIYKIKTNSDIINTTALLGEERAIFDSVAYLLSKYRCSILDNVANGKDPIIGAVGIECNIPGIAKELSGEDLRRLLQKHNLNDTAEEAAEEAGPDDQTKSVRFLKPVPKFLGAELESYGPFEEDDIASLPSRIARILVKKQRAEEIRAD